MSTLLFVTDSDSLGGAEIAMCAAAEALAARGVRVTVAVPPAGERLRSLLGTLKAAGVAVREAPLAGHRAGGLASFLRRPAAEDARRLIAETEAEAVIINLHMLWRGAAILDAVQASPRVRVSAGYLQLGKLPSEMGARFGWFRDRLTPRHLARFDVLLAVSEAQARVIRQAAPARPVITVYQPVPAVRRRAWLPRDAARRLLGVEAPQIIGLMSRVVFRHKGHDVAVRVAERLRAAGSGAHWVVAGDGPDLPRLRVLVKRAGLEDRIHFLGWRSDLLEIVTAFDVLAMPSRFEGLPLAAVEGISAGVPVVAFAVDGFGDLLTPPFAVPLGDEAAFANSIQVVLEDPSVWPREDRAALVARLCDPDAVAARIGRALGLDAVVPPPPA